MEDVDHLRKGDGINVLNSLIRIIYSLTVIQEEILNLALLDTFISVSFSKLT